MIELTVGIVVGLVVFSAILIPVVNNATATEATFTNDGFMRMSEITDESEDVVITWAYTAPYDLVIGDEIVKIPTTTTAGTFAFPYTIFANDGWGVRVSVSNNDRVDINLYGSSSASLLWYATTAESDTVTITLSEGTATFKKASSTAVTQTYTSAYIPDNNGEYTLKKMNSPAYMTKDSIIYSTGRSSLVYSGVTTALNINVQGNIDDGATVTVLAPTGYTVSNIEVNASAVSGYIGLYSLDSVTFDVTNSDDETASAVYSQVIVPYQVTVELANHLDSDMIQMIKVIPILIIAGLIVGIAATVISRRE